MYIYIYIYTIHISEAIYIMTIHALLREAVHVPQASPAERDAAAGNNSNDNNNNNNSNSNNNNKHA